MRPLGDGLFGPEDVALLRRVMEGAWASLPPEQRTTSGKTILANSLLHLAGQGERDEDRLRECALQVIGELSDGVLRFRSAAGR